MNELKTSLPVVLSIAGSDNTGGAGIQADIKTCISLGIYPCTAITAVTAQNHKGLARMEYVGDEMLHDQLEATYEYLNPDAVKIGLIPNSASIRIIADILRKYHQKNIVIDTVLGATSGGNFSKDLEAQKEMINSLTSELFPISSVITPNIPEAFKILEKETNTLSDDELSDEFYKRFELNSILLKGGHGDGITCNDILYTGLRKRIEYNSPRIDSNNTHGTGCVLSTAIACGLAKNYSIEKAIGDAKKLITAAILKGKNNPINRIYGPVIV